MNNTQNNNMTLLEKIDYLEKKLDLPMEWVLQAIKYCDTHGYDVTQIQRKKLK